MIALGLLATGIGFLLGLARQRVTVLLPACLVLLTAIGFFSVATGSDGGRMTLAGVLGLVCLQAGYLAAIFGGSISKDKAAARTKSSALSISHLKSN